jgi:hypothetical protein
MAEELFVSDNDSTVMKYGLDEEHGGFFASSGAARTERIRQGTEESTKPKC